MKLDPAIIRALKLNPSTTHVASHGGSAFSTTAKITTTIENGSEKHFFMKTGTGEQAKVMFEGEHASLNAIHNTVPSLCPASLAFGVLEDPPSSYYLVTDFLDLSHRTSTSRVGQGSGMSLAEKLARLHTTAAPIPEGFSKAVFGFPVTTCCGDTAQTNGYKESWAEYYAENRLRAILEQSEHRNGKDAELRSMVEKTVDIIVPRLLWDDHLNNGKGVTPVVVHGDLWSGNKGRGRIGGSQATEDVIYDPSVCYGHSEFELGIMSMFGGFSRAFYQEYHRLCPKSAPVEEYEDRVSLYELYHHLNHYSIFSGGYRGGAMAIMRKLQKHYSNEG